MATAEYIGRMKTLGDEMAAAGRKLEDDELVEYILTRLDEEYDSLASNVLARTDPISVSELYSLMLAFETRVDLHTKGNSSRAFETRVDLCRSWSWWWSWTFQPRKSGWQGSKLPCTTWRPRWIPS
jgi:hypothetical protein